MGDAPMTSDEVNYLVYSYLAESGYAHSSFSLLHESALPSAPSEQDPSTSLLSSPVPPGHLIRILHKGLLYLEAEARYRGDKDEAKPRLIGYSIPDSLPLPALPVRKPTQPTPVIHRTVAEASTSQAGPSYAPPAAPPSRSAQASSASTPSEEKGEFLIDRPPSAAASEPAPEKERGSKDKGKGKERERDSGPSSLKRKVRPSVASLDDGTAAAATNGNGNGNGKRQRTDSISVDETATVGTVEDVEMDDLLAPAPEPAATAGQGAEEAPPNPPPPLVPMPAVPATEPARPTGPPPPVVVTTKRAPSPVVAKRAPSPSTQRKPLPSLTMPNNLSSTPTAASQPPLPTPPIIVVSKKKVPVPTPAVSQGGAPRSKSPLPGTAAKDSSPKLAVSALPKEDGDEPTVNGKKKHLSPAAGEVNVVRKKKKMNALAAPATSGGISGSASNSSREREREENGVNGGGRKEKDKDKESREKPLPTIKSEEEDEEREVPPPLEGVVNIEGASAGVTLCRGHTNPRIQTSSWNPKVPSLLATGGADQTCRIWDVPSSTTAKGHVDVRDSIVCKHASAQRKGEVCALGWDPSGSLLATGTEDGITRVWTPSGDLHLVLSMHQQGITSLAWNAQGTLLLTGSADHTACLWELSSGKVRQQFYTHSDKVVAVAWMGDEHFATASADKTIHLFNINKPTPIYRLKGHRDEVNAVELSPCQTLLASSSDDKTVRIWSLMNIAQLASLTGAAKASEQGRAIDDEDGASGVWDCRGHSQEVHTVAWAPWKKTEGKARLVASASFDSDARLWDAETGSCLHTFSRHVDHVYAVVWNPFSGDYFATAGNDGRMCVWRLSDRKLVMEYEHVGSVYRLAWHPTRGDQVVVCGEREEVAVVGLAPALTAAGSAVP